MKKPLSSLLILLLLMSMVEFLSFTAYASPELSTPEAPGIDENYIGVSRASVDRVFSGGNVISKCDVMLWLNYSATVTMQLKKNNAIESTWNYTIDVGDDLSASETYGAVSGSTYQVVVKIRVYDSSNSLVEIIPLNTNALVCP